MKILNHYQENFDKLYKASLIIDNVVKKCSKFHPQHRQYMPKMVQLR